MPTSDTPSVLGRLMASAMRRIPSLAPRLPSPPREALGPAREQAPPADAATAPAPLGPPPAWAEGRPFAGTAPPDGQAWLRHAQPDPGPSPSEQKHAATDAVVLREAARTALHLDHKSCATGALIALQSVRQPVWSPRDMSAFAREGYMQNPIVYRCVRMIAEAAASIPMLLYAGDEEIEQHPLLSLIRRPNAFDTRTDLFTALLANLLFSGNAYLEAVGTAGEVRELHVLRPDRVKVVPGPDGWPEAWDYTVAGRTVRIENEPVPGVRPVLHLKLFHPIDDHYGMSPLEAAASAIDLHNIAARWNKALLDNSARPSGALVYTARDGNLTTDQYERLKSELEQGFQGSPNAGRPLLLEGGLDWKSMSLSPNDMDFTEARHNAAREIALALGVPPMLLGIPGDNTYSNLQEATRIFWRTTVLPLAERVATALTNWLSPAFATDTPGFGLPPPVATPATLRLVLDTDDLPALADERDRLWSRLEEASFLTEAEKRAAVGYAPKEVAPSGENQSHDRAV